MNDDFLLAIQNGNVQEVNRYLSIPTFDPSFNNGCALFEAIYVGHDLDQKTERFFNCIAIIKALLAHTRIIPNDRTIQYAALYGYTDIVEILLKDPRVKIESDDNLVFRWAASGGHLDVVKLLLTDQRIDPSSKNNDALCQGAVHGHIDVVTYLLTDPRVRNYDSKYGKGSASIDRAIKLAKYDGGTKNSDEIIKVLSEK